MMHLGVIHIIHLHLHIVTLSCQGLNNIGFNWLTLGSRCMDLLLHDQMIFGFIVINVLNLVAQVYSCLRNKLSWIVLVFVGSL